MKVTIGKYLKNSNKPRKVLVVIDEQDVWCADNTLALIIAPMLVKLKSQKQGSPCVDDEDVPAGMGLRSTECEPKKNEWDTDGNFFKRWDWVLDEMIWAMQEIAEDRPTEDACYEESDTEEDSIFGGKKIKLDTERYDAYSKRLQNALELFGKYFQSLWT